MNIACYIRERSVIDQLKGVFERAGHDVLWFDSEASLLRGIRRHDVDMVLVDLGTRPCIEDGIFSWLRLRTGDPTPVILMSAQHGSDLVALALDSGADDFIKLPFEAVELRARIQALQRRSAPPTTRRSIAFAGYTLDRDSGHVAFQALPIQLTAREFSMAWLFFSSPGTYISRRTIGAVIWGADSDVAGRTIEQHVYKLRKKLQVGHEQTIIIRTAYSQGYRLELCTQS